MRRDLFLRTDDLSRRDFLAGSAYAFLGLSVLPLLGAKPGAIAVRRPTAKNIIYLYMSGGMSHLDTFDPKPGTEQAGPVTALKTSADGLQISQYLPLLAKHMHRAAVVRSLTSNQGAHEQGNYFMHTSYRMVTGTVHPTLGSWMLNFSGRTNRTIPGNIVLGGGSNYPGAGYLDSKCAPLLLGRASNGLPNSALPKKVTESQFNKRMNMLKAMNSEFESHYQQTEVRSYAGVYEEAAALMKSSDLAAFDLGEEPQSLKDRYGTEPFAQGCLLARRLIEHGVRYVEVDLGGWDTHTDNFDRVETQSQILDQAMDALIFDLSRRGMLEETLVVVATEFGRSPEIVDNEGRNHYPKAFSGLMLGGGIKGGQAYGKTDEHGATIVENPVSVPDFNATIAYAAGLPLDETVYSSTGRPFTLADKGKPILELFA
jgi:hypothetical protein